MSACSSPSATSTSGCSAATSTPAARSTALPPGRIAELYPSVEEYENAFSGAVDDAIDAGVVLEDDRSAIEGYAKPELVG